MQTLCLKLGLIPQPSYTPEDIMDQSNWDAYINQMP